MFRRVTHLDADAFFASVEQASDVRLRGRPVAVGGERRGIVASASYEARQYGVYTPMPTVRARKLCPQLIVLPGDYEKYERFSRWMFSYAYDFTPDVEITSVDEGYFDLTAVRRDAAGLVRIGQVADMPLEMLELLVGAGAPVLRRFARGMDERPIVPGSEPAKSYGQQETFERDQTDEEFLAATLRRMADNLMAKVRAERSSIRTVTVKVRYNDMSEDQCGESLLEPTDLETDLYGRLEILLRRAWKRRVSLRLVSLRLSQLYRAMPRGELALDRAVEQREGRRRLARVMDELRASRAWLMVDVGWEGIAWGAGLLVHWREWTCRM